MTDGDRIAAALENLVALEREAVGLIRENIDMNREGLEISREIAQFWRNRDNRDIAEDIAKAARAAEDERVIAERMRALGWTVER